MGIKVDEGYPVEIHKLFRVWFIWGFWSQVYLVVSAIIFSSLSKYCGGFGEILGKISCCLYLINCLVWIVVGAIFRYSNAG